MRRRAPRAYIDKLFGIVQRAARIRAIASPLMETLGGVAVALVILYGGHQVLSGARTPGAFFSFITALLLAYQPLKSLAGLNASMQEGLAAAQRIFTVLDIEPAIRDKPGASALKVSGGEIRFDRVEFVYANGAPALSNVSLTAPAGKRVALVGPSGAGKSTMLNLVPRFYDVASGRIAVDGQDVRDVTLASLRAAIALVSQEVTLFDDTVKRQHRLWPLRRQRCRDRRRRQGGRRRRVHPRACPRATTPRWASTASSSRAGSANASPSPAPCSRTRRSCCWTRRPRRSTPKASTRCRRRSRP